MVNARGSSPLHRISVFATSHRQMGPPKKVRVTFPFWIRLKSFGVHMPNARLHHIAYDWCCESEFEWEKRRSTIIKRLTVGIAAKEYSAWTRAAVEWRTGGSLIPPATRQREQKQSAAVRQPVRAFNWERNSQTQCIPSLNYTSLRCFDTFSLVSFKFIHIFLIL